MPGHAAVCAALRSPKRFPTCDGYCLRRCPLNYDALDHARIRAGKPPRAEKPPPSPVPSRGGGGGAGGSSISAKTLWWGSTGGGPPVFNEVHTMAVRRSAPPTPPTPPTSRSRRQATRSAPAARDSWALMESVDKAHRKGLESYQQKAMDEWGVAWFPDAP